jgi:molybdate transport system substrate-binding protein
MLSILVLAAVKGGFDQKTLNVSAAASLKEAFTVIARRYEAAHPDVSVKLNFAGTQTLAAQIAQGAPADVFASASMSNLREVDFDPGSLRNFVQNRLEIALRKGLPGSLSIKDLPRIENIVIAAPAVPAGHYAEEFLKAAAKVYGAQWEKGVRSHIVSREVDVKAVLSKVQLGEADAGIVYVSDVVASHGQVGVIPIPDDLNQIAVCPAVVLRHAQNRDDAKHFIKFLVSPESQRILETSGFISPTRPVGQLTYSVGVNNIFRLPLPFPTKYPRVSVEAADEEKVLRKYQGVLVVSLPGMSKKGVSATFRGADGYSQTVSAAELKSRKAVVVRNADGNYQLIVPGLKPSVWVNWLRIIEVR